jgi:hypothetical protein
VADDGGRTLLDCDVIPAIEDEAVSTWVDLLRRLVARGWHGARTIRGASPGLGAAIATVLPNVLQEPA